MATGAARPLALRPMGVGEVIDAGFGLARHNFRLLVQISAWAVVPGFVVSSAVSLAFPIGLSTLPMGIAQAVAGIAIAFACGAILDPDLFPSGVRPTVLYRAVLGRLPSLLAISILITILVVPLLVILPLGIFIGIRWSMVLNAVILDRRGPLSGLRESWQVTRGAFWHTFGVLVVSGLLYMVFSYIVAGVFGGFSLLLLFVAKSATAVGIVSNLASGVTALLITPFTTAINVVLFFELKSRSQGFDLVLRARQLRSSG
ncbi:MAG TPA: glycerophosphoryl diester phosphodiesterase membrane domain-containing protein [Chloroflexota bacterium]|nr:glycerophosphoryl diester phosphodiesterase membrane domain-containing protein [Chloroflexota bacterium]